MTSFIRLLAALKYISRKVETAKVEPGDLALYQEDLSGASIGAQVEGREIVQGSYEVAEHWPTTGAPPP